MEKIDLNPGDYHGTYKLVGGAVSLDFINTVSWRNTERSHDWMEEPMNFITWAKAVTLPGIVDLKISESDVSKTLNYLVASRELMRELLEPLAMDSMPSSKILDEFNSLLCEAVQSRYIDERELTWQWRKPDSVKTLLNPIVWDASQVLTGFDRSRIKRCNKCHWLYYDVTRNKSRRWCTMEDCGSRSKSLKYYHKMKKKSDQIDD